MGTGGAHCCGTLEAWPAERGATAAVRQLGGTGAEVLPAGPGHAVVVTADDWPYQFAPFASSGFPIVTLGWTGTTFVDTTSRHLDLVRADATHWMTLFDGNPADGLGYLAAWAADECRLSPPGEPGTTLEQLQAQGRLSGPPGRSQWPTGSAYLRALDQDLVAAGFCRSAPA